MGKLKLGTKILLGFSVSMVTSLSLWGMAVYEMVAVSG